MTRARRSLAVVVAASLFGASASIVFAQSAADKAAAEALFDEGKKLMASNQFDAACAKFAQSDHLDPAVGTMLNLANCYEKGGKTASAWEAFRETAARAKNEAQKDREEYARAHAAALEKKLSKLSITVSSTSDVPGLTVKRDGEPIDRVLWGTPVPVDPGAHVIEAIATGKKKWSTSVTVAANAAKVEVPIPTLDADPAYVAPPTTTVPSTITSTEPTIAPTTIATATTPTTIASTTTTTTTAPPITTDEPDPGRSRKIAAVITGGVGAVSLLFSGYFALRARAKNSDANPQCTYVPGDPSQCNQTGVDLGREAHHLATASEITFIGGMLLVGGGVVLWLTAPKHESPNAVTVGLSPSPASFGLTLKGGF